jgi:pimeloyl-ACP methyl ester carboxylesterase
MAAARRVLKGAGAMSFYEKGPVRIHYEETGSGYPLLLIPGGGLNSVIAGLANPFDAIGEFKGEYRCIAADLRNANPGQSSGPLEIDRPWDSHTDDQLPTSVYLIRENLLDLPLDVCPNPPNFRSTKNWKGASYGLFRPRLEIPLYR